MTTPHPGSGPRRLMRSRDRKLAGVCGGVAEYLDLDPTVVRVVFVVLLLFPFFPLVGGVVLYLLLWLVMPEPVTPAGPPPAGSLPAVEPSEPAPAGSLPLPAAPASQAADDGGRAGARLLGGVLLAAGVLFLLQRLAGPWWPAWWMPNLMMLGWPLLLIVIGGLILLSASSRRP